MGKYLHYAAVGLAVKVKWGFKPAHILNPAGGKPKGMRWHTFERLTAAHHAFVGVSLAAIAERFGLTDQRLTGLLDV